MRKLQLSNNACARVWSGELPNVGYPAKSTVHREYPISASVVNSRKVVGAVEVCKAAGHPSSYGLLGGELTFGPSSSFTVALHTTSNHGQSFTDSLASSSDTVYVGLPAEYVDGVFEGVTLAMPRIGPIQPGRLTVSHAAHGKVGSSLIVFKQLSILLLSLLYAQESTLSDESLLKLFSGGFDDCG